MAFKFNVSESLRDSVVGAEAIDLLAQIEEVNALSAEIADLQSYGDELAEVQDNLASALAHVESFGVTKTFLATFDSEYELSQALEVQEIALSSLESMSETALEKLDNKFEVALEGKLADAWKAIKDFFSNMWKKIAELATKFWNWIKGLFGKNKEKAAAAATTAAAVEKDPAAAKVVEQVLATKPEETKEVPAASKEEAPKKVTGVDIGYPFKTAMSVVDMLCGGEMVENFITVKKTCIDNGVSSDVSTFVADKGKYESMWQRILDGGYKVRDVYKGVGMEIESNIAKDPVEFSLKVILPDTKGKSAKELGWGDVKKCKEFLNKYNAQCDKITDMFSKADAAAKVTEAAIQKALANLDKAIAEAKKADGSDGHQAADDALDYDYKVAAKYRAILKFSTAAVTQSMAANRAVSTRLATTVNAVTRIVAQAKSGK